MNSLHQTVSGNRQFAMTGYLNHGAVISDTKDSRWIFITSTSKKTVNKLEFGKVALLETPRRLSENSDRSEGNGD